MPFAAQRETLETIRPHAAGKLVIDCTVPLKPPKVGLVQLPPEGSAAELARAVLGPEAKLASAFHNVGAKLLESDSPVECDVLVFADDDAVRAAAASIVEAVGLRPIEAGPLANSAAAEALTSVLIQINRRYKARACRHPHHRPGFAVMEAAHPSLPVAQTVAALGRPA